MDAIASFDRALFIHINTGLTSGWLDVIMPYVTQKSNFLGVIIVSAAAIWIFGRRQDRIGLVVLVLLVGASDLVSDGLKHVFARVRPCNAMEGVRLLAGCSGSYSFPSGHATNIFAAMTFLSLRYKRLTPAFLLIAVTVAYSRVYVGVHYPLDVMGGALLGMSLAFAFFLGEKMAVDYFQARRAKTGEA